MKNLLTTEREKAQAVAERIVDLTGYGRLHVNDILPDITDLVSNVIKATLDSVREGMPEVFAGDMEGGDSLGREDRAIRLNAYRTALLNHLKELEKGEV